MLEQQIIYMYDGTFAGFLCCVFQSYDKKQLPLDIQSINAGQTSIFESIYIKTDKKNAQRVQKSIQTKLGLEVYQFLQNAFLTNLWQKELYMLEFIRLAYKGNKKILKMLTQPTVHKLNKAVQHLHNETMHLRGFLRFSIYEKVMVAVITPKNFVLPLLAPHFKNRFPREKFLIYDKTNSAICIYENGQFSIDFVQEIQLPSPNDKELYYRTLWREFHKTIAIKERINPTCQNTLLAKRYRPCMTEFQ